MAVTYSSVACAEEYTSISENYAVLTGGQAQVQLRCAWLDRHALLNDLLGTPRTFPYNDSLTAMQASCVPAVGAYSKDDQGCLYEDALVTVSYSNQIVDVASESIEPFTEFNELDFRRFRWTSGTTGRPLIEGEQAPFQLPMLNLVRTRYRLSSIPEEVLTCLGCCNSIAYTSDILGLTFPAETMLFQPQGINRSFTTLGTTGWTLGIKFACKPWGWNKFWNSSAQAYQNIYLAGASVPYKPYTPTLFGALLT